MSLQFCTLATMMAVSFFFSWEGEGQSERGVEKGTGKVRVEVDPKYYRPTEVVSIAVSLSRSSWYVMFHCLFLKELLLGDASKAKRELGWEAKTKFKVLTTQK